MTPTEQEQTRAVQLGRLAGRTGTPVLDACPYTADQRGLRYRFAQGYAEGKADRFPDWVYAVREWLTRVWYGTGED